MRGSIFTLSLGVDTENEEKLMTLSGQLFNLDILELQYNVILK